MRVGTIGCSGFSITIAGVARLKGAGVGALGGAAVGGGVVGSTLGATVGGGTGSVMLSGLGVTLVHPANARVRRSVPVRMRGIDISDEMHF